jgi:hypothetical protein
MSLCDSSEEAKTNKNLDKNLRKYNHEEMKEIKILLLGTGGS